jgi:hypothetical protein
MALKIDNMNKIIWGIAILGGGYLLYNYAKKHLLSTNEMNQFVIMKSSYDFSSFDKKYIQNRADAIRNGSSTFDYNGAKYNSSTGKKVI